MKRLLVLSALIVLILSFTNQVFAQTTSSNSGTIRGTLLDPSGMAIMNATVEIQNPVSRYSQTTQTNNQGKFEFDNIPFNNYHVSSAVSGFRDGYAGCGCALAGAAGD